MGLASVAVLPSRLSARGATLVKFLKSGIEISPLMMPLRREPYAFTDLPRSESALYELDGIERFMTKRFAVADRFAIGTAPRVLGEVKSAIGRAG